MNAANLGALDELMAVQSDPWSRLCSFNSARTRSGASCSSAMYNQASRDIDCLAEHAVAELWLQVGFGN
jgi:hypothetical protein